MGGGKLIPWKISLGQKSTKILEKMEKLIIGHKIAKTYLEEITSSRLQVKNKHNSKPWIIRQDSSYIYIVRWIVKYIVS